MPGYAIGDIHGCFYTLLALLEKIDFNPSVDKIYFIGDYIDRGPFVYETLTFLCALKEKHHGMTFLIGNHEDMFLRAAYGNPFWKNVWLENGGTSSINALIKNPSKFLSDSVKNSDIDFDENFLKFIMSLKLFVETENHFLVHGNLCWHSPHILSNRHHILWNREHVIIPDKIKNKSLVHGHTPLPLNHILAQAPDSRVFCIDGGCVYYHQFKEEGLGYLIALRLDDNRIFAQKNVEPEIYPSTSIKRQTEKYLIDALEKYAGDLSSISILKN